MVPESPKTLAVPEAGRIYFGLGRNASYQAAARGELPVIKIGGRLRVPVIALDRMLDDAGMPQTRAASSLRGATAEPDRSRGQPLQPPTTGDQQDRDPPDLDHGAAIHGRHRQ